MPQFSHRQVLKTGIPWWLAGAVIAVCAAVAMVAVLSVVPVNPDRVFQDALADYNYESISAAGGRKSGLVPDALRILSEFPTHAGERQVLQGIQLIRELRPLKAIPVLESAARLPEVRPQALAYLGQAQSNAENYLDSVHTLRSSIQADDRIDAGYLFLTRVLYELGAWDEALDISDPFVIRRSADVADTRLVRSMIQGAMGRYADAAAELEDALAVDPQGRMNRKLAMFLMDYLNRAGEFRKSLQYVAMAEKSPQMQAIRAIALVGIGDLDAARDSVNAADQETAILNEERSGPGFEVNRDIRRALGAIAIRQGRDVAARVLDRLSTTTGTMGRDIEFMQIMAELAAVAERPDVAANYLREVAELTVRHERFAAQRQQVISNLTDVDGRILAGDLAMEMGDGSQASFWYTAAARLDPAAAARIDEKFRRMNEH